ncbi:MAG: succinate dehydrogenase, cytochrome b556 subunit, partial [Alphaproteobacteria bacterium]
GTLLLVWWIVAAATGESAFANVQAFIGSWIGRLLLLGWSFAVFYHLCNGIRHLFWDAGKGFELETAYMSGRLVVGAAIVLTIVAWVWGYSSMGAF